MTIQPFARSWVAAEGEGRFDSNWAVCVRFTYELGGLALWIYELGDFGGA